MIAAHTPAKGVSRPAWIAANLIPLTVLPSGLWRIADVALGLPLDGGNDPGTGQLPTWLPIWLYVIFLSILAELLAFTAIGLVAEWGETFPQWIPLLRGRNVPVPVAVIPAALGATVLTTMWTWAAIMGARGKTLQGNPQPADNPLARHDWHSVVLTVAYAPLLLWGPLLAFVTLAYWRRRRVDHHQHNSAEHLAPSVPDPLPSARRYPPSSAGR
jgi:hypothetical protein